MTCSTGNLVKGRMCRYCDISLEARVGSASLRAGLPLLGGDTRCRWFSDLLDRLWNHLVLLFLPFHGLLGRQPKGFLGKHFSGEGLESGWMLLDAVWFFERF